MEICYLAKGEQIFHVGNENYCLHGGDIYVTFPNEVHDTDRQPLGRGTLYWLIVAPPQSPKSRIDEMQLIAREFRKLACRKFTAGAELQACLERVFTLAETPKRSFTRLEIKHHLMDFLLRVLEKGKLARPSKAATPLRDVVEEIKDYPQQDWSISKMAEMAGLSVPRLKSRFRQEMGIPPWEFVLQSRIAHSKDLLLAGQRTITEIAYSLEFSSSQHFATTFRKFTGMTPTQFCSRQGK